MAPPFRRGQVIWCPVLDPQDRNLKERPCVVLGCNEELAAVVGVTSTLDEIDPADRVDLPFGTATPCHTGLKRPSAVNCRWQEVIPVADVRHVMGFVLEDHLTRIVARVAQLRAEG